ncbi:MAG: hypothetical protein AAF702_04090 [Chloroflexota bacterium]
MKIADVTLPFCYKGERMYVHGSDIYNHVNEYVTTSLGLTGIENIDVSFHKIATRSLKLSVYKGKSPQKNELTTGTFKFQSDDEGYTIFMVESNKEIDCRYPYSEHDIVDQSELCIEQKQIQLDSATPYTDIEVIIAMNKGLLQALYPDVKGKWYLARYQSKCYTAQSSYKRITVALKHNFNFKLTKSQVAIDGNPVGAIYFSMT